ncbi:MAG TPA: alpha/beta hydrolase, partial [Clostridia bacterium]
TDVCEKIGDEAYAYAEKALTEKHMETAKQFFLNASHVFRCAQFPIVEDNEHKKRIYRKLIDSYEKATYLFEPKIERVVIPFENYEMTGYLRLPNQYSKDCPVVISVGGGDGWREEHHNYSEFYVKRGIAYFIFDGPGQGETRIFNNVHMPIEVEKSLGAVVDFMYDYEKVGKNIGIVGYSYGGYMAARAAAFNNKIKASCSIGGAYDIFEALEKMPHLIKIIMAITGKDESTSERMARLMTLKGLCKNIESSLLVIHGGKDHLFSVQNIQKLYNEASSSDKTIKIWESGNHCCTNYSTEVTCTAADWFMDKLKQS